MPQQSVKYKKQMEIRGSDSTPVALADGITKVKEMADVKVDRSYKSARPRKNSDQAVELVVHLGIDAKQADQLLRGSLSLPKGVGKSRKVIAFCPEGDVEKAKAAGSGTLSQTERVLSRREMTRGYPTTRGTPQVIENKGMHVNPSVSL